MARFRVGQRVRIVRVGDWAQLLGSEHRVVSVGQKAWSSPFGWYVGYGLDGMTPGGSQIVAPDFCIEPILPEGHQPAELTVEELLPFLKAREVA